MNFYEIVFWLITGIISHKLWIYFKKYEFRECDKCGGTETIKRLREKR